MSEKTTAPRRALAPLDAEPARHRSGRSIIPHVDTATQVKLNQVFLSSMLPICTGLILIFSAFVVFDWYTQPAETQIVVFGCNVATLVLLLGLRSASKRSLIPSNRSHLAGACIVLAVLFANMASFALPRDPMQTCNTMLLIIAVGGLFLSSYWVVFLTFVICASWAAIANFVIPASQIPAFSILMFAGSIVGLMLHFTRLVSYRNLEHLREKLEGQNQQMSEALLGAEHELEERMRAEAALRESENRYRCLVDASPVAIAVHQDGVMKFANETASRIIGAASPKELMGRAILDLVHPSSREIVMQRVRHVLELGLVSSPIEIKLVSIQGKTIDVEISGMQVSFEGKPAVQVVFQDISERRRADHALRRSESYFRSLIQNSSDVILVLATDGEIRYASPSASRVFGYRPEQTLGRRLEDYVHGEDHSTLLETTGKIVENPHVAESSEFRLRHNDGKWRDVAAQGKALIEDGEVTGLVLNVRDQTERNAAEAERIKLEGELQHIHKMEAIGTLAGGVAHDFNNLLGGILGYASMLKAGYEGQDEKVFKAASTIETAAGRAAELTSQLLGFARKGKHQNVRLNLHDLIHEAIGLLTRTVDKNIQIEQRLEAQRPEVLGDPAQLQQILLNLAVNSRDAMPQGGRLTFRTEDVVLDEGFCRRHAGASEGPHVLITTSDTGEGIPRDIQDRIFEPFFTTKDPGKGTGMGLAMIYGIVKNHGGSIYLYSEPGQGTAFKIFLPIAAGGSYAAPAPDTHEPIKGKGRILVVDDEEVIRNLATDMLEMLGYDVMTAVDGLRAVEDYAESLAEIDLAIIDMIMPNMGGRDCFRKLRELRPDLRAVLSTGYGRDGAAQEILDEGMVGFVQKPYRIEQLSEVVSRALS